MTAPALPPAERLTDWEPTLVSGHRCVRCRDGEKPCVRGNPDGCEWRKKLAALIAATEAAVERLWAYPEDEWSSETRTTLRAAINAARKE